MLNNNSQAECAKDMPGPVVHTHVCPYPADFFFMPSNYFWMGRMAHSTKGHPSMTSVSNTNYLNESEGVLFIFLFCLDKAKTEEPGTISRVPRG